MNSLWGMLGKPAVPRVDTDDVYPLHMLDNTKTLRSIVVTWTLRFDDVLDADKLHNALARLLDMSDWRKLGGRMRLSVRVPACREVSLIVLGKRGGRDPRPSPIHRRPASRSLQL
jgi:hypothetical protein